TRSWTVRAPSRWTRRDTSGSAPGSMGSTSWSRPEQRNESPGHGARAAAGSYRAPVRAGGRRLAASDHAVAALRQRDRRSGPCRTGARRARPDRGDAVPPPGTDPPGRAGAPRRDRPGEEPHLAAVRGADVIEPNRLALAGALHRAR